jgi:hypothetical protein
MYRHGCSLREEGAHLAASRIDNNFEFSTGWVENALALHLLAMISLMGYSVFALFAMISFLFNSLEIQYCSFEILFYTRSIIPININHDNNSSIDKGRGLRHD